MTTTWKSSLRDSIYNLYITDPRTSKNIEKNPKKKKKTRDRKRSARPRPRPGSARPRLFPIRSESESLSLSISVLFFENLACMRDFDLNFIF